MADLASAITAAQDGLVALLAASEALADYSPAYGEPSLPIPKSLVYVGEDAKAERETPFSGPLAAQGETFTIEVIFHAHRKGKTALQMRAIADAGEAAIIAAIAQDNTLGGSVAYCAIAGTERKGGWWDAEGKELFADRRIGVECVAYV